MMQMLMIYVYPKRFLVAKKNYKYFMGYANEYEIKSFSIILPKKREFFD